MVCPKCKKEFDRLLALSRFSDDMICSECGNKEAIEVLYNNGLISKEDMDKEFRELDKLYDELK